MNIEDRIKSKITKKNGCWIWKGAVFKSGYGQLRIGGRNGRLMRAHRVSYECFREKISDGLEIDHLCRNTLCVNPDHLQAVTHSINMQRRRDSGLNYCKHGHRWNKKTTYVRPDNGRRECRKCIKVRKMRYNS